MSSYKLKDIFKTKWQDHLSGGLADRRLPKDFDKKQLALGIKHELEHTDDPKLAAEIAMDHLSEDPNIIHTLRNKHHTMSKRQNEYIIYALIDPTTNKVKYVGKSVYGMYRAYVHMKYAHAKNDDGSWKSEYHVDRWIRKLSAQGITYISIILEKIDHSVENARQVLSSAEKKWISHFRELFGDSLTNIANGGDGVGLSGEKHPMYGKHHTKEAKLKQAMGARNRIWTDNHRKRFAEILRKTSSRPVICLDDRKEFTSAKEAALYYGHNKTQLARSANSGGIRLSKGMRFSYLKPSSRNTSFAQTHGMLGKKRSISSITAQKKTRNSARNREIHKCHS